jgi:integrase
MATADRGYIYERKDSPFFYARVTITGKRRTKGGFETRAAAQRWINEQVRDAEKAEMLGLEPVRDDVTLHAILPRWMRAIKHRITASTLESYKSHVDKILIPYFGDKPLTTFRKRDIEDFLAARSEAGRSNATLNRYLSTLSRVFAYAVDHGCARTNPCRDVRRAREEPKTFLYLSPEDQARLLAAMASWLRTPSLVALDAGLRAGEIGGLGRRDVDLNRGVLTVRRSKNHQPREVGMTVRLKKALARHMKTLPKGQKWVFLTPDGSMFDRAKYRHDYVQATKAADLEGLRFHDLRHSCGVRLAEAGATPAMIKAVLGHKSLAATMRYMDHAPLDAARTAARLLDPGQGTDGANAVSR